MEFIFGRFAWARSTDIGCSASSSFDRGQVILLKKSGTAAAQSNHGTPALK
jgi:hypothetical protein